MADRLTFVFSASPGGTLGHYFSGVVEELDRRGHRVTLLAPPSYEGSKVEDVGGTDVVAWPPPEAGRRAAFRLVDDLLRRHPADATVSSFSGDNVLQAVARRRRVPARLAWHHTPSTQLRLDGAQGWRWAYQRRGKALLYRQCTDLLVATDYVARDIQDRFGVPAAKIVRETYAMPDPGPSTVTPVPGRVLFVGRFHPSKGHDWFLRSLPTVARDVPELALRLTGVGGPDEARIRALVDDLGLTDRCTWLGNVSREALFEELGAATVSVVPSRAEGFGLVTSGRGGRHPGRGLRHPPAGSRWSTGSPACWCRSTTSGRWPRPSPGSSPTASCGPGSRPAPVATSSRTSTSAAASVGSPTATRS